MENLSSNPSMELSNVIGFNGNVPRSLRAHPDGQNFIYFIGNLIVIENLKLGCQEFLQCTDIDVCDLKKRQINCLALSKSARYLAVGYESGMNFMADLIIWDYEKKIVYDKISLHKGCVESIDFSFDNQYLYSLGGIDDRRITSYKIREKKIGCFAEAQLKTAGPAKILKTTHTMKTVCVTAGRETIRVWCLEEHSSRLIYKEIRFKKIIRHVSCVEISPDDTLGYAGTYSGDIMLFSIKNASHLSTYLVKEQLTCGITQLLYRPYNKGIIIGTGSGVVTFITNTLSKIKKEIMMNGKITSIVCLDPHQENYLVGTSSACIYILYGDENYKCSLLKSCHHQTVNDVAFPWDSSDLIISASSENVRVWSTSAHKELSKMIVPNNKCTSVEVMRDGKTIITGWSDCKIRAFSPESGKPIYLIESTYGATVTCLTTTPDSHRIISGSDIGHVVIWYVPESFVITSRNVTRVDKHILLKGHRAPITCVKVRTVQKYNNDSRTIEDVDEVLSCSLDGTLNVWDVRTQLAKVSIKTNFTMFYSALFHPKCDFQVISTGTGGKISYYEILQGLLLFQTSDCEIRATNLTMDSTSDGRFFITGDSNNRIKIWSHENGKVIYCDKTHTTPVQCIRVSRDMKKVVSTGLDGTIYIWSLKILPEIRASIRVDDDNFISSSQTSCQKSKLTSHPPSCDTKYESCTELPLPVSGKQSSVPFKHGHNEALC